MKNIKLALCLGSFLAASPMASAHDFWLEPGKFQYDQPASVALQFKIGHHDEAGHWNLRWDKLVALRNYTANGVQDLAAGVIPYSGMLPGAAKTGLLDSGSYVIGLESYHSVSELEAEKFNQYLAEEGLKAIQQHRQANNLTNTAGTELYSRKAKTIVQVGQNHTAHVTQPIGHTLEIVPTTHPGDANSSEKLAVKVLFKGEPLPAAMVDAIMMDADASTTQTAHTGQDGVASFALSGKGAVKLTVVWGVPLQGNPRADYETYFASLTMQRH